MDVVYNSYHIDLLQKNHQIFSMRSQPLIA